MILSRIDRRDLAVVLFLAVLTLGFYYPLTLFGRVIADLDALTYFYPHAIEYTAQLRAGQLPLWDPLEFAGVPFLANSQLGALYPPTLLYLAGPVSRVYAILAVVHVWWLAVGCYGLGRVSLRLSRPGAAFAAVAIAFSGFVGGMVGHLNQVEALAWTPFAIVLVERAITRASWRHAFFAAIPFALCLFAGHSQVLYFTGVLAGLAGLGRLLQGRPRPRQAAAAVGRLALGPSLGALVGAAQLAPTLELTRLSIRSTGLNFADASAFSLPPSYLLTALFPTVGQAPPSSEWLGYLGLATLLLAGVGLVLRPRAEAIFLAVLALVGLLLALGHFTPLYEVVFRFVPGVRLFRVPARWLTFWVICAGLLGGYGLDAVLARPLVVPRWRRDRVLAFGLIGLAGLLIVGREAVKYRQEVVWPAPPTLALWGVTAVALGVIVLAKARRRPALTGLATIGILVGELAVGSTGLPVQNAVPIRGVEVQRHTDAFLIGQNSPDRILALGDNTYDPGDLKALRASVEDTLSPSAESAFVTAIKHAEGLTPNLFERFGLASIDGYDGGILPLARYDDFKKLFPVQGSNPSDGRLRLQLVGAPDPHLLGWLNVRYLLMDRLRDQWIDGAYYDLAVSAPLPPDSSLTLTTNPPFTFNRLGVILSATPNGPPIGVLTLQAGQTDLKLNLEDPNVRRAGRFIQDDFDANGAWLWTLDAPAADTLSQVTVRWTGQQEIGLRSLSAIDSRLPDDRTITTSRAYQVAFLEDMKVYVNQDVLPRAFLSRGVEVVPSVPAALAAMRQPGWDPRSTTVAVGTDVPPSLAFRAGGDPGTTRMAEQADQRVVVDTQASGQRLLVLTDSYYPGWQATIDGRPAPIYEVNLMFRGVVVPPGAHQVVFTYQPASWRVGVAGSGLGIIVLIAGLWLTRRRPPAADD